MPRPTPSPAQEVEAVADRLHSAALHLLRRLRLEDDVAGLSPSRFSALAVIAQEGQIPIGELATVEGVAAPTMSRLADGLERDGLILRARDPEDGRGVLVRATPKGTRVLERGRAQRLSSLAETLAPLSPQELSDLGRAFELIERVLTQ